MAEQMAAVLEDIGADAVSINIHCFETPYSTAHLSGSPVRVSFCRRSVLLTLMYILVVGSWACLRGVKVEI